MTLTLNTIRAKSPCHEGWTKLLTHLGKTKADDEPLDLLTVLDGNGLDDALWVLDQTGCNPRLARHFGAWCAEQVLLIFERERPDDMRPRQAIAAARNDDATDVERLAAGAAAQAAASAAGAAAGVAAGAAAWAASAAGAAAWSASAAQAAAQAAASAAGAKQLRAMLVSGEY